MTSKRRTAQIALMVTCATLLASGIAGAIEVPSGLNIAVALIIAVGLLVEAPLTAMALARHQPATPEANPQQ